MDLLQGLDIVYIPKFKDIASRNMQFIIDVFTEKERLVCTRLVNPFDSLAGRFAAKEALLKAIGIGFTTTGVFQDIEVTTEPSGRPAITFKGWIKGLINRRRIRKSTVSISHSADYAAASVILIA